MVYVTCLWHFISTAINCISKSVRWAKLAVIYKMPEVLAIWVYWHIEQFHLLFNLTPLPHVQHNRTFELSQVKILETSFHWWILKNKRSLEIFVETPALIFVKKYVFNLDLQLCHPNDFFIKHTSEHVT